METTELTTNIEKAIVVLEDALGEYSAVTVLYQPDELHCAIKEALNYLEKAKLEHKE